MASLMENLIDVLAKECDEYEELLALSEEKTPIIVSADLELLKEITEKEQLLVDKVNHFDRMRVEVMKDMANVLNKDVQTLKISNLIEMLAGRPEEQNQLKQSYERLQAAVDRLKLINEHNKELIQNALEMVNFEMTLLQSVKSAPETANYNRGAYNAGNTMGITSGFDARQ